MPRLLIKSADGKEQIIPLNRVRTTIGRSVRNDICIADPFASRFHAEIRREGDIFWLRDLGSANGTFRNGEQISQSVKLAPYDEIQLGETKIIFQNDSPKQTSTLITEETLNPSSTVFLDRKQKQDKANRDELLALINKVGTALLGSTSLEETLDLIVSLVFEILPAERCAILFLNRNSGNLNVAVAKWRNQNIPVNEIKISRKILEEVVQKGNSILTSNVQADPILSSQTVMLSGIGSILAVPLSSENEIFGMIYTDSPTKEAVFKQEHLSILTTLASVASIRIEKARLMEEKLERERLEHELKLAAEIQQGLQPAVFPCLENYEFDGISLSCYEVGGDYYDFIQNGQKVILALGDVSGKGTSAALMMASLHAAIHTQIALNLDLEKTVYAVNQYLVKNTPQNRFVTLFIGELDCENGTLKFINAGHEPALVVRKNGEVEKLTSNSLPLGLFETLEFSAQQTQLLSGDVLVVFSDGVSEATAPNGEEFGIERLTEVIKANLNLSAAGLRDKIDSALSKFTNNASFRDDVTLLIAKRKA